MRALTPWTGVQALGDLLAIKGEKKQEKAEKTSTATGSSARTGAFTRAVRLPVAVDAAKVTATFETAS
jgi:HSP20 family molecular chaperone IbpA